MRRIIVFGFIFILSTTLLACDQITQEEIETLYDSPLIELIGEEEIELKQGDPYEDPGITALDIYGEDLVVDSYWKDNKALDTSTVGDYILIFEIYDGEGTLLNTITRTIVVTPYIGEVFLNGEETITLLTGEDYDDLGVSATDPNGEPYLIETSWKDDKEFDTDAPGVYTQIYNIMDADGVVVKTLERLIILGLDQEHPNIFLLGEETPLIPTNTIWEDPGVVAYDAEGHPYEIDVEYPSGETLDTSIPGTYEIFYHIMDGYNEVMDPLYRKITIKEPIEVIELIGSSIELLPHGTRYEEEGIIAHNADLENYTVESYWKDNIEPNSFADTYNIKYYEVFDQEGNLLETLERTIITGDYQSTIEVELSGFEETFIEVNTLAFEHLPYAVFTIYNDLEFMVEVESDYNGDVVGEYDLIYNLYIESGQHLHQFIHPVEVVAFVTITNEEEFIGISNDLDGFYRLENNIDLNNQEWTPIGSQQNPFTGYLDGNGYSISNAIITQASQNNIGLFGEVQGTIKNLYINNISIALTLEDMPFVSIGLLAGKLTEASISQVSLNGSITVSNPGSYMNVGSLAGQANESFIDCITSQGDLNLSGENVYVGGIVGEMYNSSIYFAISHTNILVNSTNDPHIGGITGFAIAGNSLVSTLATGDLEAYTTGSNSYIGHISTNSSNYPFEIYENNYGYIEQVLTGSHLMTGHVAYFEQVSNPEFYIETMHFPEEFLFDHSATLLMNFPTLYNDGVTIKSDYVDSEESTILTISTEEDLALLEEYPNRRFILTNDIYLSTSFSPLFQTSHFQGELDGQGYRIIGMTITSTEETSFLNQGFIIYNSGYIHDLGLIDFSISGTMDGEYIAGFIAYNYGILERIYINGSINITSNNDDHPLIASLTSENRGFISDILIETNITVTSETDAYVIIGGVSAMTGGQVKNILANVQINASNLSQGQAGLFSGGCGDLTNALLMGEITYSNVQNTLSGTICPYYSSSPITENIYYPNTVTIDGTDIMYGGQVIDPIIITPTFLKDKLLLDDQIWNFNVLTSNGLPTLQNIPID